MLLDLVTASAPPAIVLPGESARRYARASKSSATLRAYAGAIRSFETWCKGRGLGTVPAEIATVVDFLSAEADCRAQGVLDRAEGGRHPVGTQDGRLCVADRG